MYAKKYDVGFEMFAHLRIYEWGCSENLGDGLRGPGPSLSRLGEYQEAPRVDDVNFAKISIDSACVMLDIGRSLYGLGKYDEAIQSFERALMITQQMVPANQLQSARIIAAISAVLLTKNDIKKSL